MARLLALTSRLPYPPREGHQLRSWHLLRALAAEHEVTLLSFMRHDDAPAECAPLRATVAALETFPIPAERSRRALALAAAGALAGAQPFIARKYASAALRARVAALAGRADLVHVDMLPLLANLPPAGLRAPLVLNAHNVEHALLAHRIPTERNRLRRAFLRQQLGRLRAFEVAACRRADSVLACSAVDAGQIAAFAPATRIAVVPNGVDLDANRPSTAPPSAPEQLVFVGQMGWFPNRDGIEWFLAEVFPRILAQRPATELLLLGKADGLRVPPEVAARVRVAGFVADLRGAVHAAALYVVPLRAGSGTRLKVLEAMALGKAIVTTHVGAEGIALEDGRDAVFADRAADFAAAVLALLAAPTRAAALGAAARALAEARYGWDAIGRDLCRLYGELLERRHARQR